MGISLASQDRSVKREIFDQAMKVKDQKKAEEKVLEEQERIRQEEEEIKKIRAQSNFKATPIKKYKNNLGEVQMKKLTVPKSPVLETKERALFKDELSASSKQAEADQLEDWFLRVDYVYEKWDTLKL